MSQPLLSILIPTVYGREAQYDSLRQLILEQCVAIVEEPIEGFDFSPFMLNPGAQEYKGWRSKSVEFIFCKDDKRMSIGEKRNRLYQSASGLFSWQIDDDDAIAPRSIGKILNMIKNHGSGLDCITFEEHCTINGVEYKSNHSLHYLDWEGDGSFVFEDGFHFHRTPFYKDVLKTSIAKSVPLSDVRYAEDHDQARRLRPFLSAEGHIREEIYLYQHTSTSFNERYGLDKETI